MPAKRAEAIINERNIRYPSEIYVRDIAMSLGAYARERELQGCEARLVRKGNMGIISVNRSIPEEGRKRFAIAHEIGHFILHSGTQVIFCNEDDMNAWQDSKKREVEANAFAANLLMPYEIFIKYIKIGQPTFDMISEVSGEFRTTLTATALRYVSCSKEPCAVAISKDSVLKWYKKSTSFNFHIKVGEKLGSDTFAFDFFRGLTLPNAPENVPACAWLAGNIDEDSDIFEQSVSLGHYGVVLSLLWIYDDIKTKYKRYDEEPDESEFDMTNPFNPDGKRWKC